VIAAVAAVIAAVLKFSQLQYSLSTSSTSARPCPVSVIGESEPAQSAPVVCTHRCSSCEHCVHCPLHTVSITYSYPVSYAAAVHMLTVYTAQCSQLRTRTTRSTLHCTPSHTDTPHCSQLCALITRSSLHCTPMQPRTLHTAYSCVNLQLTLL
jgi:hypothetical protein